MIDAPTWTEAALGAARSIAVDRFREERVREPRKRYLELYDHRVRTVADVVDGLLALPDPAAAPDDVVLGVVASEPHLEVLRYLAAPPVSSDDLEVLAETSLSPGALRREPARARLVFDTIMKGLDPRRFPWVGVRAATPAERDAAIVASTALLASRRTETERRGEGKTTQEGAVFAALDAAGFRRAPARPIPTLEKAPLAGTYCAESQLGDRKADVVVRLWDGRLLAVECKVSNSATNSIKRLNNDAAVKAVHWVREFGLRNVVPSAMLAGVYKLRNLIDAQAAGLTLWWSHDLAALTAWVEATRAPSAAR